ncbi:MAG: PAS domain S-box protein, partial [Methylobacter sp.]
MKSGGLTMAGSGSVPRIITDSPDGSGNTTVSINNGLASSAAALAESEERFRQMAEMTGEWLWEQDPGGYYTYSSIAVNQILGFSPDEVIGKHYTEFLTPQDKADQQPYATSHQPFYALINHYRHKDGHQVLTESSGLPIIDAKGKLLKWRGVDRDITARKHFQDALIENEKRTRLIIESSLSAIVIMDSYGIIIDWNHQAEKMFGWSRNEAIDQRLQNLIIPPRFRKAHRQGLQHFLQTGIAPLLNKVTEQVAIRRDGSEFPVELSISPLKLGNTYIFSGFIHDITTRKATEAKVRQAQINLAIAQSEIKIAQRIQASLSPSAPIKSEHFEVAGFCLPADQIGGDYFDYFFRNEDQLDMIIADV